MVAKNIAGTLVHRCRPNSTASFFFKYLPQAVRMFFVFFNISSLLQPDLQCISISAIFVQLFNFLYLVLTWIILPILYKQSYIFLIYSMGTTVLRSSEAFWDSCQLLWSLESGSWSLSIAMIAEIDGSSIPLIVITAIFMIVLVVNSICLLQSLITLFTDHNDQIATGLQKNSTKAHSDGEERLVWSELCLSLERVIQNTDLRIEQTVHSGSSCSSLLCFE